jgi:predicted glycoside hydrolase/deacetylase ChbG (UPF0249 family)
VNSLHITADDFGWTDGHNLAVERAHADGVLTHASLMANGDAFDGAVDLARRRPTLRVGMHLTLSEGCPLLPAGALPSLTRPDGTFHDSVVPLLAAWLRGRLARARDEALAEWRAQIDRAIAAGIRPSHLDSHKHVHMLPPLCDAIVELAKDYGVPYVRLPLERLSASVAPRAPGWLPLSGFALAARARLRKAGLAFADRFVGFGTAGRMTPARLARAIAHAGPDAEIMTHPAVVTDGVNALRRRYRWARA